MKKPNHRDDCYSTIGKAPRLIWLGCIVWMDVLNGQAGCITRNHTQPDPTTTQP